MNKDKVKSKLLSETIEFRLATLLVLLMPKTLPGYKDLFSDLQKENLIFSNRNLMILCMNKVKKKFLNLFTSSFIGRANTSKTKLKEFVIPSLDKDTNFLKCKKFKVK